MIIYLTCYGITSEYTKLHNFGVIVVRYLNACEQHFEQPVEQSYSEWMDPPVFVTSSRGKPRVQQA